jgi:hypothetical protein
MATKYTLLNPTILGDFKSQIKAKNSSQAAKIFYTNLSEHFNNTVPLFHFTIQKGGSGNGKFYHYEVKEEKENNTVNFKIKQLENIPTTAAEMKPFVDKLEKFKQKMEQGGGDKKKKRSKHKSKRYDDSSDSDSDSDDFYKRVRTYKPVNQPIYYWWYDPYVYNLDTLYVPTFYSYITPYIELGLYPYYFP